MTNFDHLRQRRVLVEELQERLFAAGSDDEKARAEGIERELRELLRREEQRRAPV